MFVWKHFNNVVFLISVATCIVLEVGSEFLPLQLKGRKPVHIQQVIFLLWWHHKVLSAWAGTTIIAWHKAWGWTQRDLSTPSPSLSLFTQRHLRQRTPRQRVVSWSFRGRIMDSDLRTGSVPSIGYKCDTFPLVLSGVVWSERTKFTRAKCRLSLPIILRKRSNSRIYITCSLEIYNFPQDYTRGKNSSPLVVLDLWHRTTFDPPTTPKTSTLSTLINVPQLGLVSTN